MQSIISEVESKQRKQHVVPVRTGDTVRVSQRIEEAGKSRVQVFEGLVVRTRRLNSLSAVITVRRIASGIGVEKTFPLHSPVVEKVEVIKRSNTRRNYLSYMRELTGKRARLSSVEFDRAGINYIPDPESDELPAEAEEAIKEAKAEAEADESTTADDTEATDSDGDDDDGSDSTDEKKSDDTDAADSDSKDDEKEDDKDAKKDDEGR